MQQYMGRPFYNTAGYSNDLTPLFSAHHSNTWIVINIAQLVNFNSGTGIRFNIPHCIYLSRLDDPNWAPTTHSVRIKDAYTPVHLPTIQLQQSIILYKKNHVHSVKFALIPLFENDLQWLQCRTWNLLQLTRKQLISLIQCLYDA